VLENTQFREILIRTLNDLNDLRPLCETFHFASRNIGFVFAAFDPVEARNKMAKFAPAPWRWPLWAWLRSAAPSVEGTFPIRRRRSRSWRFGSSQAEKVAQIIGARELVREGGL
jgi:hypothetical protein